MEETQTALGGGRQSKPLGDEMAYPLTMEEYQTLKENLITDTFTNWEAFLFTTFITTLISIFVICCTTSFEIHTIINNVDKWETNYNQIIIVIIYGGASFGSLIGFLIAKLTRKNSKKAIHRLVEKIDSYLK